MSNVISSAIFCARNVEKAETQDKVGRWAVAAGQAKKVFDYVQTLDNKVGEKARSAQSVMKTVAKEEKIVKGIGKAVDYASKNVNPLICVSSGIDVLRSDDKEYTAVTSAAALAAMFGTEAFMKDHMDSVAKKGVEKLSKIKGASKIIEKVATTIKGSKYGKAAPAIVHGTAFVVGSCLGYAGGEEFGKLLIGREKRKNS